MQTLFLGGWDGHRLDLFDDTSVEPGVTKGTDLAHELSYLTTKDYAVLFVESDKLTPDVASPHGIFCESPVCLVVLDRKGGSDLSTYGSALAIFEISAMPEQTVQKVWIDGREIRPPGPKTWPQLCLSTKDTPHYLHPDGAAFFPARESPSGDGYALFGPKEVPRKYHSEGFPAPTPTSCVEAPLPEEKPEVTPAVAPPPQANTTHKRHHKSSE